jgi:hypothetical protein
MRKKEMKTIYIILLFGLFSVAESHAEILMTMSGGVYNYELTTTERLTSEDVKLFNNYYSVLIEAKYGVLSYDKTLVKKNNSNFQRVNYKSSPLIFYMDNPYAIIVLPSFDSKEYYKENRKFTEKTMSIWMGLFSCSEKIDNSKGVKVTSRRYGLTTSQFSEELRYVYDYAYNNQGVISSKYGKTNYQNNFWYTGGSAYYSKGKLLFYSYCSLAYDYYGIDVDNEVLGYGIGIGFTYGLNVMLYLRYELYKNHSVSLGFDTSYYEGKESISFYNDKIDDDITRLSSSISLKYIGKF